MDEAHQDWAGLLAQTRRHDPAAAEALIQALYPVVRAVVYRRKPASADARDLTQDALLRVLQGLPGFRGEASSLPAWTRRVTFRVCLNEWRRLKSRPETVWSDLTQEQAALLDRPGDNRPPSDPEALASRELLSLLLHRLSPEERWVIEMADLEQRSPEAIQELTGWSPLNIRVRRFRARQKLRRALQDLRATRSHEA
jgi:RNA polymerase sigma-70 factor (ECF subfamily)